MPSITNREMGDVERVMGIEPTWLAWKARALPLSYTRRRMRVSNHSIINQSARFSP